MRAQEKMDQSSKSEKSRDALLLDIAQRHLCLATLETRNSDRLDFHETAVWAIRAALEEAFEAGRRADGAANTLF